MFSARKVFNTIKQYTDDTIVLSLAKNWLKKNNCVTTVYNLFGIKIEKKFEIEVYKTRSKYNKIETVFELTTGKLFKKKFTIKLV